MTGIGNKIKEVLHVGGHNEDQKFGTAGHHGVSYMHSYALLYL